ncbi:hypothetical protein AC579_7223 [Pseudocercospora musae]|uniref:Uncharacterized protein n=1 Tax=Pseudocercospora musae TaxID=113226 RepID=A0A139IF63_9PEZI|nr:hypothetical protein AC579_7223 [Pseudocercospora musae]
MWLGSHEIDQILHFGVLVDSQICFSPYTAQLHMDCHVNLTNSIRIELDQVHGPPTLRALFQPAVIATSGALPRHPIAYIGSKKSSSVENRLDRIVPDACTLAKFQKSTLPSSHSLEQRVGLEARRTIELEELARIPGGVCGPWSFLLSGIESLVAGLMALSFGRWVYRLELSYQRNSVTEI